MESETREGSRDEGGDATARTDGAAGASGQRAHVSRGVAWELDCESEMCTLSGLSVAFEASRHASEDAYILISDCLPGMRPRVEAGAGAGNAVNAERTSFTRHRDWVLRSPDRSLGSAQRASGYRKSGPSRVPALGGRVLSLHGAASPAHEIRTRRTSSRSTSGTGPVTTSTPVTK
mgnify:CR=1 FL=1